ncbi:JAB domain-containing protein (plasmid) [Clostridium perfringens]|uniref:DNA repair protein RadC n=1 Tax=Clostridium perfringens (strain 13 / Type A) TaxID=195102 RepID=Q93MC6_CLOPE|nr:DNA repair protein RadC [Clostridium perfringens]MDH2340673.1 DNA repair protein RadC [Clostridium perfringens]MDM0695761.1 DNA repair protein RadC [Clostridium perfringens]MDN4738278.1 DNA repair protein RadC [Clostridium perfringens]MDN4738333.1 DNA repair protein RadC [Clostridium perfringens]MDN4741461.1 DNA repair protein RadC [Clostridium perfringens]
MKKIDVVKVYVKKEQSLQIEKDIIKKPEQVFEVVKNFLGEVDREYLIVIVLDVKNKINSISVASVGTLNSSIVHPREVFKTAILANGASIILAHNHPSGDTSPSKDDINITTRIKECGVLMGIELLDHVILGDEKFISLKNEGII